MSLGKGAEFEELKGEVVFARRCKGDSGSYLIDYVVSSENTSGKEEAVSQNQEISRQHNVKTTNENQNKIFNLYNKFHNHKDGKGVGLYMVKTQVTLLDGTISVSSKPNVGTTFSIIFPKL